MSKDLMSKFVFSMMLVFTSILGYAQCTPVVVNNNGVEANSGVSAKARSSSLRLTLMDILTYRYSGISTIQEILVLVKTLPSVTLQLARTMSHLQVLVWLEAALVLSL